MGTPRKAGTKWDSSPPVAADLVLPPRLLGAKLAGTGPAGQAEPALSALHGLSAAAVKTQGRRPPRDAEAQTGVMGEDVA